MEFSLNQFLASFFRILADLSKRYGPTGEPVADIGMLLIFALIAFVFFAIFIVFRRVGSSSQAAPGFDLSRGMNGRLEKLEMTLNSFKTEVSRSNQITKGELGFLVQELQDIKGLLTNAAPAERAEFRAEPEVESGFSQPPPALDDRAQNRVHALEQQADPASLTNRLKKTREGFFGKLKSIFGGGTKLDENAISDLEELLITSDLGVKTATALIEEVRSEFKSAGVVDEEGLKALLKIKILSILEKDSPLQPGIEPHAPAEGPFVVLVAGVNGVGKTTTVAKLAAQWKESGYKVLMVAADTFRAAAVDQLMEWGERINVPVICGTPDTKPQTVVFDAMQRAKSHPVDVIIIDTAGRLHNKSNLMQELEGVLGIIRRHQPDAPHETLLVLDGATGQNALSQAKEFHDVLKLTGIVITKLDGTPKGGIVVAIKNEFNIPVRYIGVGESKDDLRPFIPRDFVEALFAG